MILAGDIGGTKTVVAIFEHTGGGLRLVRDATFKSKEHPTLEGILGEFLKGESGLKLDAGCFGVAGAVIDGKCRTTNLPWQLDEVTLARAIGAPRAKLLNDLEAAAFGMLFLRPDELKVLNAGVQPKRNGNVAVVAAGTGLGEAMLYWDGQKHHPIASEGGHADFAPRNDLEIEMFNYLRPKFDGHVSYERILSGPGFDNVYAFLRDSGHYPETPELREKYKGGDPTVIATQLGLRREDPLCTATVDLFSEIYGAEAGNLALKCVAVGGVYVGGGIAPKMLVALENGSFMRGFTDKGRFSSLMRTMPVSVSLNPRAPLIGAANFALRLV